MANHAQGTSVSAIFNFESHQVRTIVKDGETWFVAKDIMECLDYAESSNPARVISHVPEEWKGVSRLHTPGGEQSVLMLAEPGLYFFLGRSDKPKALPFQKCVAGEIIPAIRKTGQYQISAQPSTQPQIPDLTDELKSRISKRAWELARQHYEQYCAEMRGLHAIRAGKRTPEEWVPMLTEQFAITQTALLVSMLGNFRGILRREGKKLSDMFGEDWEKILGQFEENGSGGKK